MIACDRTSGATRGYVHLAWYDVTLGIRANRSTNGGASWGSPKLVSDSGSVQWPVPAVGPTGQVYVGWVDFGASALRFDTSTNAGQTFGSDTTITTLLITNEPHNGGVDVLAYPAMMVDITAGPRRGTIYVAYIDRQQPGGDTDIFLRTSTDQGNTWSEPVRVNEDPPGNGRDQFHPWLVVDETYVLRETYLRASCEWTVIVCSDMQFDPYDLEKFYAYLKDYDIIISARAKRQDRGIRKYISVN